MKTFFIADTHFNCPRLVELTRPWTTPAEHDKLVLDAINSTVKRRDRLFILGDFCKGRPFKWREQIKCRNIWFILGNHDTPQLMYQACFGSERVRDSMLIKVGEKKQRSLIYLSHYPHCHYPHSHYGAYHFYGHTHSQKEDEMDSFMPDRRSMDVGVDNLVRLFGDLSPLNAYQALDMLGGRTGHGIIKREDRWEKRDYSSNDT